MSDGISFQLLGSKVDIHCEDPSVVETLNYIPVNARQPFPITNRMTYSVSGTGPYRVLENDDFLENVTSADDVLFVIYGRVHRRVLERAVLSGWVVLHGALASINESRTLLIGHKGSGKTTLATRLLFSGHPVVINVLVFDKYQPSTMAEIQCAKKIGIV